MLPIRGLLAAVIALLIAAGLVWWSRSRGTDAAAGETTTKLLALPAADLTRIELRRAGGETTVLERGASGSWSLTAPAAYPADAASVETLVNAVAALNADKVVEEKTANFGDFGLTEPAFTVLATTKDGKLHTVMVGDEVPAGGGNYARLAGSDRLFTIAAFTKTSLDKPAAELRDKRMLPFDPTALTRVELKAKGGTVEFGKNAAGNWQIVKPEPWRADGWQVEELIRRVREAQIDPALPAEDLQKNEAGFARAAPVATATLAAGAAFTLEVRRAADNRYLARSSAVDGVHPLSNDTGEGLDKSAADFRSRKLFDFGFAEPTRVEFRDGVSARAFTREAADWKESGKTIDSVGVQSLIDRLRDLSAESFPASGFTSPEIEASITAGSGGKSMTEKIFIARAGQRFFARRDGENALYELKSDTVEELRRAARDVKEAPAPARAGKK